MRVMSVARRSLRHRLSTPTVVSIVERNRISAGSVGNDSPPAQTSTTTG